MVASKAQIAFLSAAEIRQFHKNCGDMKYALSGFQSPQDTKPYSVNHIKAYEQLPSTALRPCSEGRAQLTKPYDVSSVTDECIPTTHKRQLF